MADNPRRGSAQWRVVEKFSGGAAFRPRTAEQQEKI